MKPKISIVTATLNAGATIRETIDSVAAQDYGNIEHLILDGQSRDDTLAIAYEAQKAHPYIKVLSERDTGLYNAMNKGLKLSSGDWIYFLGGDDRFYNERVLSDLHASGALSNRAAVHGDVHVLGDASWARNNEIYDGPFTLEKLLKKNICHQAIFYPREMVKQVGLFNEKYNVCADWDYNLRCFAAKEFVYVDMIIAYFKAGGYSTVVQDEFIAQDFRENVLKYFAIDRRTERKKGKSSVFAEILAALPEKKPSFGRRLKSMSSRLTGRH